MSMKRIEITHPGMPSKDDPQVEVGMGVWDYLNANEQREVFRSLYRSLVAARRTGDQAHIDRFVESVHVMVRLESTTDLRQKIRESRNVEPAPADPAAVEALIRRLESR